MDTEILGVAIPAFARLTRAWRAYVGLRWSLFTRRHKRRDQMGKGPDGRSESEIEMERWRGTAPKKKKLLVRLEGDVACMGGDVTVTRRHATVMIACRQRTRDSWCLLRVHPLGEASIVSLVVESPVSRTELPGAESSYLPLVVVEAIQHRPRDPAVPLAYVDSNRFASGFCYPGARTTGVTVMSHVSSVAGRMSVQHFLLLGRTEAPVPLNNRRMFPGRRDG